MRVFAQLLLIFGMTWPGFVLIFFLFSDWTSSASRTTTGKKTPFLVARIMNTLRTHTHAHTLTHAHTHMCKCMRTLVSMLPLCSIVLESGFISNRIARENNSDLYIQRQASLAGADVPSLSTQCILSQTYWRWGEAPELWLVCKVSSYFTNFLLSNQS